MIYVVRCDTGKSFVDIEVKSKGICLEYEKSFVQGNFVQVNDAGIMRTGMVVKYYCAGDEEEI
jgi:hypothetical protein